MGRALNQLKSFLDLCRRDTYVTIYILICVLGLSLLCYRMVHIQMTHDEAYSFWLTATNNIRQMAGTANNHWLNSIFMWIQQRLLGYEVWMLRVHNVFAYTLLLFYGALFFYKEKSSYSLWVFSCLILCNTYLQDYFVLARGYGLGCSFAMAGLYYFKRSLDAANRNMFKAYLFFSLATLSNFTFIYVLCAVFVLDVWHTLRSGVELKTIFSKASLWEKLPFVLTLCWSVPNILFIKYHTGDLEEGLKNGILKDTISGFLHRSYDGLNAGMPLYALVLSVILLVLFTYIYFYRRLSVYSKRLCELFFLLCVMVQINFYILHTPYPYARVSIYFNLLLLLLLVDLIVFYMSSIKSSIRNFLLICLTCLTAFGLYGFKIETTKDFWMSQGIREAIQVIKNASTKDNDEATVLMSEDHIGAFINYYSYLDSTLKTWKLTAYYRTDTSTLTPVQKEAFSQARYCLLVPQYEAYFKHHVEVENYTILAHYPLMRATLYVKKYE